MPKAILMGDPSYFSVLGGANPHTRNVLGIRRRVDSFRARRQWRALARTLIAHGVDIFVLDPHRRLSGLVYPANAGFVFPPEGRKRRFYLANLLPTRAGERDVYRSFLASMGFETHDIASRFEGEADFFPAGDFMLFTYGRIERQRFAPRLGLPPWRRIYGFRSDLSALRELQEIAGEKPILPLELCLEAHYHGDTVLCSFGPKREFLLAFMAGLTDESRQRLRDAFGQNLIELAEHDGAIYAANSFQTDFHGKLYLFLPEGVSDDLKNRIRDRGVEPVAVDVSEFLAKGGGSVKCMILDLGQSADLPESEETAAFRNARTYQRLFAREDQ